MAPEGLGGLEGAVNKVYIGKFVTSTYYAASDTLITTSAATATSFPEPYVAEMAERLREKHRARGFKLAAERRTWRRE